MDTRRDEASTRNTRHPRPENSPRILERLVSIKPELNADRAPRAEESEAQRQFVDHSGLVWRVREMRADQEPQPSLLFESELGWRKVRSYPTEWRGMSREALERLSKER